MIDKNTIPGHWKIIKISEIGNLLRGINYKKEDATNYVGDNYVPILRANNINGELNFNDLVYVPKKYIHEEQFIKAGDIVFAMSSGSKHLVGKSAKAKSDFNGSFGAFCAVFRSFETINKDFVAFFFQSPYYKQLISEISKGTNINNLKREHILDLDFPLPVPSEQQKIVSKIEELFSELDKGKQQLETVRQQLKTYRQAVLKWAFEGRFTSSNRSVGTSRDLSRTEENQKSSPEGWKWVNLDEICDSKRKCSYGVLVPGEHDENGIRLLRVGDINDTGLINQNNLKKISPTIAHKYKRTFLEGGEVVISLVGAIGRTAVVPYSLKGANIARAVGVIPVSKEISSKFVELMLRSPLKIKEHNEKAHEVARKTLNLEDVKKSKIPLPPRDVQDQIVQEIETRLSVCDKMEETIENCLQQTESLRQSILKQAFEGKLI